MQDRLEDIEERLTHIEQRLAKLEGSGPLEAASREAPDDDELFADSFLANASTHIGRVLLIFGGAYLLRAITDFGLVPTAIGLTAGALYALYWLYIGWRQASDDSQRAKAAFYAATSVVLTLPLLVEAATTFGLLSGPQAVAAAGLYFGLAFTVGVQRRLRSTAWLVTGGAGITAVAILITTHSAVTAAILLLVVGLASLWAVYVRGWLALQWLGAIGACIGVVALITLSQSPQWSIDSRLASLFATLLLLGYLLSFALRSQVLTQDVGLFETVQAPVTAGLAFWAATLGDDAAAGTSAMGILAIVLGLAGYAFALLVRARSGHPRNFYYYSSLGLVFVVAGTAVLLPSSIAATLWSAMAVLLAWQSGRQNWVSLSLQCTVLLLAASVASGLLSIGFHAFVGDPAQFWPEPTIWLAGTALATVVCLFIPVAQHSDRWGKLAGMPQLLVLALSVWGVGGLFVILAAPVLEGAAGPEANAAILAAVRTAVLAAAAVTLALSSRFPRWPEARWLVYPVLVVVAIKLFAEDFPVGQPATLFVALGFVGGALLIVARLLAWREASS